MVFFRDEVFDREALIRRIGPELGAHATVLVFGKGFSDAVRQRIETADAETLLAWSERILTAQCLDEVLRGGLR